MAEGQNINLLEKGFAVIELLSRSHCELGVSDISRRLKLVKSGAFRILNTLKDLDYVYQNPVTREYGLGIKFFFIGSSVQSKLPLCNLARQYVEPLGQKWQHSLSLSIPIFKAGEIPSFVVIYATAYGYSPLSIPGTYGPLHATATGKCLLAHMSESELQSVKGYPLQKYTDKTLTDWDSLYAQFKEIRYQGLVRCQDEYHDGVTCYAVPVFDSMHSSIGALSIAFDGETFAEDKLKKLVLDMKQACSRIGTAL